ncbi:hypothetical protein VaNZ11_008187 [Volvox africanus]|uniref:Rhodanese domain-containing protein n=1 Tax=Volvox africanus TaxID=51714 RepID=A0ABQ5S5S1_9CHLO|nr:hypothetical protein VaNZ11_008187 [Volvox africanus]
MVTDIEMAPPSASKPLTQHTSEMQGILLYYKYLLLQGRNAEDVANFYTELCKRLDLRGRIRVARDGINVTVGGSMSALQAHAAAVTAHPLLRGSDIDFKLATSGGPRNEVTRSETKMDRLVVRLCEELVTLGPLARHRADPRASTAPHLTPEQFHQLLERATAGVAVPPGEGISAGGREVPEPASTGAHFRPEAAAAAEASPGSASDGAKCSPPGTYVEGIAAQGGKTGGGVGALIPAGDAAATLCGAISGSGVEGAGINGVQRTGDDGGSDGHVSALGAAGAVVLLDARNIYETRIGHFHAGPSVTTLDPRTRCFSDLPAWLDAHEELLRNRTVLMYCTGGVRCERASAYLQEKGPEFNRVFQLSGGIQRYLERFPEGGYFRGKNFLYDDRIAVGPEVAEQVSPGPWSSSSSPLSTGVVGRCLMCRCPWDDYGARLRCSRCRLLVLVCDTCSAAHRHTALSSHQEESEKQRENPSPGSAEAEAGGPDGKSAGRRSLASQLPCSPQSAEACTANRNETHGPQQLLCELCSARAAPLSGPVCSGQADGQTSGRLPANGGGSVERMAADGDAGCARPAATRSTGPTLDVVDGQSCGKCTSSGHMYNGRQIVPAVPAASLAPPIADAYAAGRQKGLVSGEQRRLRILCLHGFRQTGKQFQGRTCALRKKLRDLAEFVFVDAPHSLPFFVKAAAGGSQDTAGGAEINAVDRGDHAMAPYMDVDGSAATGASYNADTDEDVGQDTGPAVALERSAVRQEVDAVAPVLPPLVAKRAWLLPLELYGGVTSVVGASDGEAGPLTPPDNWKDAPSFVDELQYTRQTAGWQESLAAVQTAVRQLGPFDGVFGFSQGAAVAAVLCALQQRQQQWRQERAALSVPGAAPPQGPESGGQAEAHKGGGIMSDCDSGFRFAVLASGFPSPLPEHRELMAAVGPLELPSLHVYGSGAAAGGNAGAGGNFDRQISPFESEALAAAFSCAGGRRRFLRHQSGHLIPATKSHAATFRAFLAQFVTAPATADSRAGSCN